MKKGQVTIFIILGIILVTAIFAIYKAKDYLIEAQWRTEKTKTAMLPSEAQEIRVYTESCVKEISEESIKIIGMQGGYIIQPEYVLETNFSKISYAYYYGRKLLPSVEKIQEELSLYIELFLPLCFDENDFADLNITTRRIDAETTINQNSVSIRVDYPISYSKDSANYEVQGVYSAEIPVRLGRIYDFANGIVENEISNPDNLDMSYLLSDEMDTEVLPQENNTIITYVIKDSGSMIDNEPYIFMFANRFEE